MLYVGGTEPAGTAATLCILSLFGIRSFSSGYRSRFYRSFHFRFSRTAGFAERTGTALGGAGFGKAGAAEIAFCSGHHPGAFRTLGEVFLSVCRSGTLHLDHHRTGTIFLNFAVAFDHCQHLSSDVIKHYDDD